jgi:hypothetical protein
MHNSPIHRMNQKLTRGASVAAVLASLSFTGCQSVYNGQVLPSPSYRQDDVQYFAPGPEFKLAREAAALEEQRADIESIPQNR